MCLMCLFGCGLESGLFEDVMSLELGGGDDTVMGIEGGRKEVVEAEGGEGESTNEGQQ